MTDGPNNPNELPEDDWAMSEHDLPITPEAEPVDEAVAKLYAPPDTEDLQEWDITTEDVEDFEVPENVANHAAPQSFDGPSAFSPPKIDFDILKPLVILDGADQEWGMVNAENDGWKMPEPVFRVSAGRLWYGKNEPSIDAEAVLLELEEVPESLSEIYAPPETEDISESGDDSFNNEELVADVEDFEDVPSEPTELEANTAEVSEVVPKKKSWSIFLWVLLIGLFLSTLLIIGVFFVFYYSSRH